MANDPAAPDPAPSASPYDPAQLQALIAQLTGQGSAAAPPPAPVDRSTVSLLGEALGGGTTGLAPADREAAGTRALLNFGLNMLSASGPSTMPRSFGQVFAQGAGGAEQSLAGSEAVGASRLAAQQAYQEKQQELRMEALKTAIPLLQMQQLAAAKQGLLGGAPAPGTSIATASGPGSYEGSITASEGTTPSTTSTSSGIGGFTEGTWGDYVKANPAVFQGMTPQQILDARKNPAIATPAITWLAQQNAPVLTKAGVQPSGPSLAVAHKLGPTAAAAVMQAPANASLADVLTASIGKDEAAAYLKANPNFAGQTAGGYRSQWANVPDPGFLAPKQPAAAPQAPPGGPGAPVASKPPAAAPTGAPAAPPVITDQPAGSAQVAGPGAPTKAAVGAVSPAVPGDVNAIIRGMTGAGADATTLQPPVPAAPPPVQVAGPGAPTAAPPAPEVLPLPDAMAKAKATGQPVLFQGGNGAAVKPDGTINLPSATSAPTPPAPDRVPSTFTYTRQPLPPDIQQRIDNPVPPDQLKRLNDGISTALTPEALQAAQNAKDTAIAKARTDAIAQGETWQQANAKQMQEVWQKQFELQQANDLKQKDIDQANATAAATRQQEKDMETLRNNDAQVNQAIQEERTANRTRTSALRTDADSAQQDINTIQLLRTIESGLPEEGSIGAYLARRYPDSVFTIGKVLGLNDDQVKALTTQELFQRVSTTLGTQLSQKAKEGAGTARGAEITQNMAALPTTTMNHQGRIQSLAFLQNMAQFRVNHADAADTYLANHVSTDPLIAGKVNTLNGFAQDFEKNGPPIIPRIAPAASPDDVYNGGIRPGMLADFPQPIRDATGTPTINPKTGKPMYSYKRGILGDDGKPIYLQ